MIFFFTPQTGLVELLTDKEVLAAKIAFARLDVNNDGSITELEARKVFEEYFSRLNSTHGWVKLKKRD